MWPWQRLEELSQALEDLLESARAWYAEKKAASAIMRAAMRRYQL